MSLLFAGIDGEMTDSELALGAKIIEIGACTQNINDLFVTRVSWYKEELMERWTDKAAAVHNIPAEEVTYFPRDLKCPPLIGEADRLFRNWIVAHAERPERTDKFVIAIGWNVGTFDLPFLQAQMPMSASYLSRRTVDLNAVCYTMHECVKWNGSYPTHKTWKKVGKEYAEVILRQNKVWTNAHNAGYDAQEAVLCWQFYRMAIEGNAPVDFTKL